VVCPAVFGKEKFRRIVGSEVLANNLSGRILC